MAKGFRVSGFKAFGFGGSGFLVRRFGVLRSRNALTTRKSRDRTVTTLSLDETGKTVLITRVIIITRLSRLLIRFREGWDQAGCGTLTLVKPSTLNRISKFRLVNVFDAVSGCLSMYFRWDLSAIHV